MANGVLADAGCGRRDAAHIERNSGYRTDGRSHSARQDKVHHHSAAARPRGERKATTWASCWWSEAAVKICRPHSGYRICVLPARRNSACRTRSCRKQIIACSSGTNMRTVARNMRIRATGGQGHDYRADCQQLTHDPATSADIAAAG